LQFQQESKADKQNKRVNQTDISEGVGRKFDNQTDQLVLTKKFNLPELIFNQKRNLDRYFQEDSANAWQMSKGNECFVCLKFCYTIIFYTQGENAANPGLVPINDPSFESKLPNMLNINFTDLEKIQPILTGTVVQDRNYVRKLKMLRAEYFAALSIC
jgi:hypothetical protein